MKIDIPEFLPGQDYTGAAQRVRCVSASNTPDLYYLWTEYASGRYMSYPYIVIDGKFIRTHASTTQSSSLPAYCLQSDEIMYKPEMTPIYYFMGLCMFLFIVLLVYRIFIKRLLP